MSKVERDAVKRQQDGKPKQRSKTYYYTDNERTSRQLWIKHTPGMDIPVRIKRVTFNDSWRNGYFDSLEMNIGSETELLKLYQALDNYFNDNRTAPYWAKKEE